MLGLGLRACCCCGAAEEGLLPQAVRVWWALLLVLTSWAARGELVCRDEACMQAQVWWASCTTSRLQEQGQPWGA